jgi:hypothetical protein
MAFFFSQQTLGCFAALDHGTQLWSGISANTCQNNFCHVEFPLTFQLSLQDGFAARL